MDIDGFAQEAEVMTRESQVHRGVLALASGLVGGLFVALIGPGRGSGRSGANTESETQRQAVRVSVRQGPAVSDVKAAAVSSPVDIARAAAGVLLMGALVAAAIRFLNASLHHPGEDLLDGPLLSSIWHTTRPLESEVILAFAALQVGISATLFVASAVAAPRRLAPAFEDRMIATHWLASGLGLLGVVVFWVLLPDAFQSDVPQAMVPLCITAVAINAVMSAINGPRATELERWALAAGTRVRRVRETISRLRREGVCLPEGRGGPMERFWVRMHVSDEVARIHLHMLRSTNWWRVIAQVVAGAFGVGVACVVVGAGVGLLLLSGFLFSQLLVVLVIVTACTTALVDQHHGRWYPWDVSFPCFFFPCAVILFANLSALELDLTWPALGTVVLVTFVDLFLVRRTYRAIAYAPDWILGALLIVEQDALRAEQRNLAAAERHQSPHSDLMPAGTGD